MSAASGISVSPELTDAFAQAVDGSDVRFLKVAIRNGAPRLARARSIARSSAAESLVPDGSKAVGEPPLMLAMSVREALRTAVEAFGPEGTEVDLGCPSTPEAVFWAIQEASKAEVVDEPAVDAKDSAPAQTSRADTVGSGEPQEREVESV